MRPYARVGLSILLTLAGACSAPAAEPAPSPVATTAQDVKGGYCDAFAVIERKCTRCHADPPVNGAPFPLDSYEAISAPSPSSAEPDRTRADRMLSAVESNFMPDTGLKLDPPVEPLTCEERTTLLEWLQNGAGPPTNGDTACRGHTPSLLACVPDSP